MSERLSAEELEKMATESAETLRQRIKPRAEETTRLHYSMQARLAWELFQQKFAFWVILVYVLGATVAVVWMVSHVLRTGAADMSDWGIVVIAAGVIAQSAFLLRSISITGESSGAERRSGSSLRAGTLEDSSLSA